MQFNGFDLIEQNQETPESKARKKLNQMLITIEDTGKDIRNLIKRNAYDPTLMLYTPLNSTSATYLSVTEVLRDYIDRIRRSKEKKATFNKLYKKLRFKMQSVERYKEVILGLKKGEIKKMHIKNDQLLPLMSVIQEDGKDYFYMKLDNRMSKEELNASLTYFNNQIRLCQILMDAKASIRELTEEEQEEDKEKELLAEVYNRAKYMKSYQ